MNEKQIALVSEIDGGSFVKMIYAKHHNDLVFYATGQCRRFKQLAAVNDILQELYLNILTNPNGMYKRYQENGIKALCTTIRYDMLDLDRRESKAKQREKVYQNFRPSAIGIFGFSEATYVEWSREELKQALSKEELALFDLYLQGYKQREIADLKGASTSTIGVRLHRIKKKLKRFYSDQDKKDQ